MDRAEAGMCIWRTASMTRMHLTLREPNAAAEGVFGALLL